MINMGNFKKYPYQDFNAFNLDFVLEKINDVKNIDAEVREALEKANAALIMAENAASSAEVEAALREAKQYTDTAIAALDLSQYATSSDVTNAISTAEQYTDTEIAALDLSQYAPSGDVTNAITTAEQYTDAEIAALDLSQYATSGDVTNAITTAEQYADAADTTLYNNIMTPVITDAVFGSPATSASNVKIYKFGNFVFFSGSIYIANANANTTYSNIITNLPAPRATWKWSGYGGYSSNVPYAAWISGNSLSMRFKSAITTAQEIYISCAYPTA